MAWYDKKKKQKAEPVPAPTPAPVPKAVPVEPAKTKPVEHIEGTTPVPVSRRWRRYNDV